jgi:four helix bundle protein
MCPEFKEVYMAESIQQLRIYATARALEDQIYELIKSFPAEQFYGLANDLHRSSSAVAHHISAAHKLFSYRLKMDELAAARREAEITQKLLAEAKLYGEVQLMIEDYTGIIKQSWGLSKWLKTRIDEKQTAAEVNAKDELVVARA